LQIGDGNSFFFIIFVLMKKYLILFFALAGLASCEPSADEKAAPVMQVIDSLYQNGEYQKTLNTIRELRANYPEAVESRKRALKIWQEASLKMAQEDIGKTDSALQATIRAFEAETNIGKRNLLGVKRDSLQVRYDALCGTVRMIHKRQGEIEDSTAGHAARRK
jgi:predicted  nucleic acid-binding Zn-ribbon protein